MEKEPELLVPIKLYVYFSPTIPEAAQLVRLFQCMMEKYELPLNISVDWCQSQPQIGFAIVFRDDVVFDLEEFFPWEEFELVQEIFAKQAGYRILANAIKASAETQSTKPKH
ncbi:hypothetical protein BOX15_Mlig013479g1 [Macrostomum lignano]|uniref:Uncharacterized protein n=1 Tax=Macrostomum lignano TaxID=282301 RepID=A0A267FLQ2_9PLAT|nr:hypothetical protein BOX15_Mlig013479g1 [Macrostomum lignano]